MPLIINGRSVVHKGSKGILKTEDVCYTGPNRDPVTYTNIAKSEDCTNTASHVLVNGNPICHKESYFSKSTGDEAGDGGGVRSGTTCGKAEFVTGSPNVFINGIPAVRSGDLMVSNNRNTDPAPLQQPDPPFRKYDGTDHEHLVPFPIIEFDLNELSPAELPENQIDIPDGVYVAHVVFRITGTITFQKKGLHDYGKINLENYKAEAKNRLIKFFSAATVLEFSKENVSIGSKIMGEYWSTSITLLPAGFKATAEPQGCSKTFGIWQVEGNLGFECAVTYKPIFPTINMASIADLINAHMPQIIKTIIGTALITRLITLIPAVVAA